MAEPLFPQPAKLFTGLLYPTSDIYIESVSALVLVFGNIDLESSEIPFANTGYYREIGYPLFRRFVSFQKLIDRESIVSAKLTANKIELASSNSGKRKVNIDPGYMTLANVFLASCKDYSHRIYLRDGVYLESEYRYSSGEYLFWPWTYPDYMQKSYTDFFLDMRRIYAKELKIKT